MSKEILDEIKSHGIKIVYRSLNPSPAGAAFAEECGADIVVATGFAISMKKHTTRLSQSTTASLPQQPHTGRRGGVWRGGWGVSRHLLDKGAETFL